MSGETETLELPTEGELLAAIAYDLRGACSGDGGILRWVVNEPETDEQKDIVVMRWLRLANRYKSYASRVLERQAREFDEAGILAALDKTITTAGRVGVDEFMRRQEVGAFYFDRFYNVAHAMRMAMYGKGDVAFPTLPDVLAIPCMVFALGARDEENQYFQAVQKAVLKVPSSGLNELALITVLRNLMPFVRAVTYFIEAVDTTYGGLVLAFITNQCWAVLISDQDVISFAITPLRTAAKDRYPSLSSQTVGHLPLEIGERFKTTTGLSYSMPYAYSLKPIILAQSAIILVPPSKRADGTPFYAGLPYEERVKMVWYEAIIARFGAFAFFVSDQGGAATRLTLKSRFDNNYSGALTYMGIDIASIDDQWNPIIEGANDPWWFIVKSLVFVGELTPRPLILRELVDASAPNSTIFPGDFWMGKILAFVCAYYTGERRDSFNKNDGNAGDNYSAFRAIVTTMDNDLPRVSSSLAQSWVSSMLYYIPDYWPTDDPPFVMNVLKALDIVCNRLFGFNVTRTILVGYDAETRVPFYGYLVDLLARHTFSADTFRVVFPWLFRHGSPTAPSEEWQGSWSSNALLVLAEITTKTVADYVDSRYEARS